MNFLKLQKMQRALDNAILAEKPEMSAEERFNKTLVALSVELAEVANCVEHFKFWKDKKGKVDDKRFYCIPQTVKEGETKPDKYTDLTEKISGVLTFEQAHHLTLVEEAADCSHFILSLANQLGCEITSTENHFSFEENTDSPEKIYLFMNYLLGDCPMRESNTEMLTDAFFIYIRQLGITTDELEQAYYAKNKVNYQRLREGY